MHHLQGLREALPLQGPGCRRGGEGPPGPGGQRPDAAEAPDDCGQRPEDRQSLWGEADGPRGSGRRGQKARGRLFRRLHRSLPQPRASPRPPSPSWTSWTSTSPCVDEVCCGRVLQRVGWDEEEVAKSMQQERRRHRRPRRRGGGVLLRWLLSHVQGGVPQASSRCRSRCRHISEYPGREGPQPEAVEGKDHLSRPLPPGPALAASTRPPRQVIVKVPGTEFKEMPRSGETARCCGGGGGVRSAYPELSARDRGQAGGRGGLRRHLVTACPFCVNNLNVGKEKVVLEGEDHRPCGASR